MLSASAPISIDVTLTMPASALSALALTAGKELPVPQSLFPADSGGPALKLWIPGGDTGISPGVQAGIPRDSTDAHRIDNPVRTPEDVFSQVAAANETGLKRVSPAEADRIRGTLTLPEFYREQMADWRARQLAAGETSRGNLSKERQALNRWNAWEAANRPDQWPAGTPWAGLPIGYIQGGYLDQFYESLRKNYAADSVISTRNHLRTVFNHAVKVGVLIQAPEPKPLALENPEDLEEDLATIWSDAEIDTLYQGLAPHPELQVALVLAINCGPRTVDLFLSEWDKNLRAGESSPSLRFRAVKTGKKHCIPLPPVVQAHLCRLRRAYLTDPAGAVFPSHSSIHAKDPERSRPARKRNAIIKQVMKECGLPDHEKPWQVCRATCCTRLNNANPKALVGSWVIGQGSDRNTTIAGTKIAEEFYYNPSDLVTQTILSAPQPQSFLSIL